MAKRQTICTCEIAWTGMNPRCKACHPPKGKPRTHYLIEAEDIAWMREVHCPRLPMNATAIRFTGNEDSPGNIGYTTKGKIGNVPFNAEWYAVR